MSWSWLKQGNFWAFLLLGGVASILLWLIWYGWMMIIYNQGLLVWQYALIVTGVVLFVSWILYKMWRVWQEIRW